MLISPTCNGVSSDPDAASKSVVRVPDRTLNRQATQWLERPYHGMAVDSEVRRPGIAEECNLRTDEKESPLLPCDN